MLINLGADADESPFGGILERIREQIPQHLPQRELISQDSQVFWQILSDSKGLHDMRIKAGKDVTHRWCEWCRLQTKGLPVSVNLGSGKNIVGQQHQIVTPLFDLVDPSRLHRSIDISRMLKQHI